jgi:hypothetical protein
MNKALLRALEERRLVSVMNTTKWEALVAAIAEELPFAPAFQRKDVVAAAPYPECFEEDVWYEGDWEAGTAEAAEIEWLRVRPRRVVSRGRLLAPAVEDITPQWLDLLRRLKIPHRHDGAVVTIVGHTNDPSSLS